MAAWKNLERATAAALGGRRHVRKSYSEEAVDVDLPPDSPFGAIECKLRKTLPKLVTDALAQARRDATNGRPALAVLKEKFSKGAIACMALEDLLKFINPNPVQETPTMPKTETNPPATAQEAPTRTNAAPPGPPLLLDAAGVAARLGCSKATVWRLRDSGKLPQPVKVGSLTRWRTADVEAWVNAGCPGLDIVKVSQ